MKHILTTPQSWKEKMDSYLRGEWLVISTTATSNEKNQIKRRARRWTLKKLADINTAASLS